MKSLWKRFILTTLAAGLASGLTGSLTAQDSGPAGVVRISRPRTQDLAHSQVLPVSALIDGNCNAVANPTGNGSGISNGSCADYGHGNGANGAGLGLGQGLGQGYGQSAAGQGYGQGATGQGYGPSSGLGAGRGAGSMAGLGVGANDYLVTGPIGQTENGSHWGNGNFGDQNWRDSGSHGNKAWGSDFHRRARAHSQGLGRSYGLSTGQLSDGLGLNPAMREMKSLWDQKKLAIIRGVGYPYPDHSHFSSMAIWQTGSPISHISSGWLGRWLDTQSADPMLAISLGSVPPPLFAGVKRSGSALPLGGLVVPSGKLGMRCQTLGKSSINDSPLMAAAAISMGNLFSLSDNVTGVLKGPAPVAPDLPVINGGNAGGDSSLQQQLDLVAKLIVAGAPTKAWSVSLGGFDTHANEANAQSVLLGNVSNSVARFLNQLKGSGRASDVTVLIYSEFGRRVKANASQGTDHGTSGPVFVIGDRINGGMYGDQPSLSKLIDGDLAVTTDFRDIYSSILERDLKADPAQILNGWKGRVNSLYK